MIVDGDADGFCSVDDAAGHLDVVAAGGGIAGGVIVHQDNRAGLQFERAFHDFARIGRRLVDGALAHGFIADEDVAVVEEQHAELFREGVRHAGVQIIDHRIEAGKHRAGAGCAL